MFGVLGGKEEETRDDRQLVIKYTILQGGVLSCWFAVKHARCAMMRRGIVSKLVY